jgi:hypothetical protein
MTSGMPRHRWLPALALAVIVAGATACVPAPPAPPQAAGTVKVMGASAVPEASIAAWYRSRTPVASKATVSIEQLAHLFVVEGEREGVRGDVAFAQAILETGWLGSALTAKNNFAGIGATDSGGVPAQFRNAAVGVRAQIQHLRAYADRTAISCTTPPLHANCEDPRFHLVTPKGKAPTWNVMGNGNWATDPGYAAKVLGLYNQMRAYAGLGPV